MEEKLVGLLVGGMSVVARDRHFHVLWENLAAHFLQALDDIVGDDDCIGAGALGDRQRNGGSNLQAFGRLADIRHPVLRRAGRQHHLRHVTYIDRPAVARRQQQIADLR